MNSQIYPTPKYEIAYAYDGHRFRDMRILTKEYLQEVYVDTGLTRKQMFKELKISEHMLHCSYIHWYSAEERKIIGGRKISAAQRINNSNKINTGVPRVLIPVDVLQGYLDAKHSLEKMSRLLNLAPQTIRANLKHHRLIDQLVKMGVPYERVIAAKSLDSFIGTNILRGLEVVNVDLFSEDVKVTLRDLVYAEQALTSMKHTIKHIRTGVMARFAARGVKLTDYKLPGSTLNSTVKLLLTELGYDVVVEFEVRGKFYDFKFKRYKLLLEIDTPYYHNTEEQLDNDKLKTKIAKENGYMLLRVCTDKKDKKITLKRKLEACLAPLRLKRLPQ